MATPKEIRIFLEDYSGSRIDSFNADLYGEIGIAGDDFHELMVLYSERFRVDMSDYLWYFHADEEGWNLGALFFRPPYCRVTRIPVTPSLLHRFALEKKWKMAYPNHQLPSKRWDLIIGQAIAWIFCALIAGLLLLVLFGRTEG